MEDVNVYGKDDETKEDVARYDSKKEEDNDNERSLESDGRII